ncbi:VOC family protein [Desulfovibrio inopinatus]|uniref:VOC family protein n=1 Tax=Desulfovibrio inopinatus TaxID=102109 RepID=UPI0003FAA90D|nr:VOC family protein [Desulfovibrio inopinatus]
MPAIHLDHLVLTVADINRTAQFYNTLLGLEVRKTSSGRVSLHFGNQKINLHQHRAEFEPKAQYPLPGSADLCFLIDETIDDLTSRLAKEYIDIIEGPVQRNGANGPMLSIYFRDPDGNLLEAATLIAS